MRCPTCVPVAIFVALPLVAQAPVLAPLASTNINADSTFGHLTYASIAIPAGVTVWFTGIYPVIVTVQGDVHIDGVLSVAAMASSLNLSGPGGVTTGQGMLGFPGSTGGNGHHATLYGSAVPFDLAGGSPGGGWYPNSTNPFYVPGGGGGGTLVLEAAGHVDVSGTVTADGAPGSTLGAGNGSGGSILLRGLLGCNIAAGATVTAMPEGIVRLDAYDPGPQVAGTVQPAPTRLRFPDLVETVAPVINATWQVRVAAPRGDGVFLAASFQPGSGTNQYGTYGIDLTTAITFAVVTLPGIGHDPLITFDLPVPNLPQLAGLNLWVQGLDWFTALPPSYTQAFQTVVH